MLAAIAEPLRSEVRLAFGEHKARYVRLRLEAEHKNLWRVAEIRVHSN